MVVRFWCLSLSGSRDGPVYGLCHESKQAESRKDQSKAHCALLWRYIILHQAEGLKEKNNKRVSLPIDTIDVKDFYLI